MNEKPEWIEKAITVHNIHVTHLRVNNSWRITDTAKLLHKSVGFVSEHVKAAQWLRSHSRQLYKISTFNEAIAFIREKELEIITTEIDL